MKQSKLLSAIFATAGIALVSAIADGTLVSDVQASSNTAVATKQSKLMQQKLSAEVEQLRELAQLEKAGIAKEDVEHMQHMLLHKIDFTLTGRVSPSHHLIEEKLAATAHEMQQLESLEAKGLAQNDIQHIQKAMLHKLGHMQNQSFVVSVN